MTKKLDDGNRPVKSNQLTMGNRDRVWGSESCSPTTPNRRSQEGLPELVAMNKPDRGTAAGGDPWHGG